jgi:nucleoside-diphosphate-sugar epimerase
LIQNETELDAELSRPSDDLVKTISQLASPLVLLGAGGKMGPTIALMAKRAAQAANHPLEIVAGSRYSDRRSRDWLEKQGIKTVALDLLERESFAPLPHSENVLYLAGMKFGTAQNPSLTWAINTIAPAHVAERYPRARIVALSTGNVYPLVPLSSGGAVETDPLTPVGEYPNAAVARERVFDYFSRRNKTQIALIRLNYAVELRYGVLVDVARKIWNNEPIDLANGYFNCIWQRDANDMILRSFDLTASPAEPWNLTGTAIVSVREVAQRFAELLQKKLHLIGAESSTALLNNSSKLTSKLGQPETNLDFMLREIAHWLQMNGRLLNKPTHFEVRDGKY